MDKDQAHSSRLSSYKSFEQNLLFNRKQDGDEGMVVNSTMIEAKVSRENSKLIRNIKATGGMSDFSKIVLPRSVVHQKPGVLTQFSGNGQSTYNCQECGKLFRRIEYFRLHLMKHLLNTNENQSPPYICQHANCDKQFDSRNVWKVHERRHLPLNNFNCERARDIFKGCSKNN